MLYVHDTSLRCRRLSSFTTFISYVYLKKKLKKVIAKFSSKKDKIRVKCAYQVSRGNRVRLMIIACVPWDAAGITPRVDSG